MAHTKVPIRDLVPYHAQCCSISSCYLTFPDCFGCQADSVCCCVQQSWKSCKPVTDNDQKKYCVFYEGGCYIVNPTTCVKGINQCFCFDSRCAFPCDDEVPCMCTYCFLTCCYKGKCHCACCASIGQMDPEIQNQATIVQHIHIHQAAPAPQQQAPVLVTAQIINPVQEQPNTYAKMN